MKSLIILPLLVIWIAFEVSPPTAPLAEICDNAIDDDGDGLIDLNDPDCDCSPAEPVSFISNPSFEDHFCCPESGAELYCATPWVQASGATTDYINSCDWMGYSFPPLPFPDGEGCAAFRNGDAYGYQHNWKEYAGTCLNKPLLAGILYRLEFFVGFNSPTISPATTIMMFGTNDCANMPFGNGNNEIGCPTNSPGWVTLDEIPVSGSHEWKQVEMTFTPEEDIYAIAIGPNCIPATSPGQYYFLDNLILAEDPDFDYFISAEGYPCANDFSLSIAYRDSLQYQWYKEGVALIGQTDTVLSNNLEDGIYQVRLIGPYSCRIAGPYYLSKPYSLTNLEAVICYGENYQFGSRLLFSAGTYYDTLKNEFNCDSIIRLNLAVRGDVRDTVHAFIFEGETWQTGTQQFNLPGEYSIVLTSYLGCDSTVFLMLDYYRVYIPNAFSPNNDGLNDVFTIFGGSDVEEILSLKVFDRWGGMVFESSNLQPNDLKNGWDGKRKGKVEASGVFIYKAYVAFKGGREREYTGSVTLVK